MTNTFVADFFNKLQNQLLIIIDALCLTSKKKAIVKTQVKPILVLYENIALQSIRMCGLKGKLQSSNYYS